MKTKRQHARIHARIQRHINEGFRIVKALDAMSKNRPTDDAAYLASLNVAAGLSFAVVAREALERKEGA